MERLNTAVAEQMLTLQELDAQTSILFEKLIQKPEIKEALDILDTLPEHLRYHAKTHTLDVIHETILFALADEAAMDVITEQAVTAAWHDVGFTVQDKENEHIAVKLFVKSKAYQTLSPHARERVMNNISDTELVMKDGKPSFSGARSTYAYVLDADLSNLGREDYFEKRALIAEEQKLNLDDIEVKKRFYKFGIDLLENHEWHTESAQRLRQSQKERNLARAKAEYEALLEEALV